MIDEKIQLLQNIVEQINKTRDAFREKLVCSGKIFNQDMTILQLEACMLIYKNIKVKMSDLSKKLNLKTSGATQLVDKLIEHKMVIREYNPEDRRTIFIKLSPTGESIIEKIQLKHDKIITEMYKDLSMKELDFLYSIFKKIQN